MKLLIYSHAFAPQIGGVETGYVFPCGNVDALARILRGSLADPAKLAAVGQAARRKMDSFSPRTNVKAFLELLDAVFEKSPSPIQ